MFCKNCGHKINEGAKFCKNCGEAVTVDKKLSETKVLHTKQKLETRAIDPADKKSEDIQIKSHEEVSTPNLEEGFESVTDPIIADIKSGYSDRAIETINTYIYNQNTEPELNVILLEIKKVIEERIVKYGRPVGKAPPLTTMNGVGSTIYGDTVYVVFLFIPVFALGRYTVTHNEDGTYSFLGKLRLRKWQKIYNWSFPALIIILWIIISGGNF